MSASSAEIKAILTLRWWRTIPVFCCHWGADSWIELVKPVKSALHPMYWSFKPTNAYSLSPTASSTMTLEDARSVSPTTSSNLIVVFSTLNTVRLTSSTIKPRNALNVYLDTSLWKESAEGSMRTVWDGITPNVWNAGVNTNSILIPMAVFKDPKAAYNLTTPSTYARHAMKTTTTSEGDASFDPPSIMVANKKADIKGNLNAKSA